MLLLLLLFALSWGGELDNLISYALENSPKVKQYQKLKESIRYKERYSKTLPNPTIYAGFNNLPLNKPYPNSTEPMSGFVVGFSQTYILPVKRDLEALITKNKMLEVEKSIVVVKRELIRDIKITYLEWTYTFKKEEILKSIEKELNNLKRIAKENYKYQKANLADILSVEADKIKLRREISDLHYQREIYKNRIDYLVGKSFELKGEEVNWDAPSFEEIDLNKSPYLRERYTQLESLKLELRRKKVEYLPDIELMVEYMARPSLSDMFSVRLGFTLPIYKSSKENMMVLEKQEEIRSKEEEIRELQLELKRQLKDLKVEYEKNRELLELTQKLLKEKRNELRALELSYSFGKADFRDILRLYREVWELELGRLELELSLKKLTPQMEVLL
jgi:outer membrane protein TolC